MSLSFKAHIKATAKILLSPVFAKFKVPFFVFFNIFLN